MGKTTKQLDKNKLCYQDYQALIYSLAWKWKRKTGWELEELISEGNVVFCDCVDNYNPKKAAFSTFLHISLQTHFGNLFNTSKCQKNQCQIDHKIPDDNLNPEAWNTPEQETLFWDIISHLPSDAKEVVELVLNIPTEMYLIAAETSTIKITKYVIQKYLVKHRQWSHNKVWDAIKKVQQALQEA